MFVKALRKLYLDLNYVELDVRYEQREYLTDGMGRLTKRPGMAIESIYLTRHDIESRSVNRIANWNEPGWKTDVQGLIAVEEWLMTENFKDDFSRAND